MSEGTIHVPVGLTTEGLLGRRYMARLIDSVIILLLIGAVVLIEAVSVSGRSSHPWILGVAAPSVALVIWVTYSAALESSQWQATVGKRLFKLRVYDRAGGRITLKQGATRSLVKDGPLILFALVPGTQVLTWLYLGAHLVVMHRSSDYQGIHDRVAGTWVAAPEALTQLRLS
jgi:uncharacterized RDD family membrane protein YckC